MTTARAGTLNPIPKPGPARIHFAYLDNERIEYDLHTRNAIVRRHVEGARTERQQNIIAGTSAPQATVCQRPDGACASGNGCHGATELASRPALLSCDRQDNELKRLPAPRVAGLLPARVPASPPDTYYYLAPDRQHAYFKSRQLKTGFRFTLEEIEVTYCDTNPERIALFKRLAMPYDLQAEYAASSQRAQDTVRTCKPKRFGRG